MAEIDIFFKNFPIDHIVMSHKKRSEYKCPYSIAESRKNILFEKKSLLEPEELAEIERQYLSIIGENREDINDPIKLASIFKKMKQNGTISKKSFGFLSETDTKQNKERVNIEESSIDTASYNDLKRFCYVHGITTGNDLTFEEIRRMAQWILDNESDKVSYTKIPEFMQQAIDLSVFAQCVDDLSSNIDKNTKIEELVRTHILDSETKLTVVKNSLEDAVNLNKFLTTNGRSMQAINLQEDVLSQIGSQTTVEMQEQIESEEPETTGD